MADPWQLLTSSQKKAMGLVNEAFEGVVKLGRDAVTQPEEALQRLTNLVAAVGDLAASSTKPMESLLASQRNLANAMTAFAQLQKEMAEVVERLAASHTAVVDSLEKLAGPVLSVSELIRSEPVVEKAQQRAKKK
jgi:enamine deaminase RidA (YjgF/YER057c/UK114 family)